MDGERQPKSSFSYSNLFNLEVFDMGFLSFQLGCSCFLLQLSCCFFWRKLRPLCYSANFYSSFLGNSNWVCLISFFFFGGLLKLLSDFSFKVCIFFVSGLCCSL